MIYVADTEVFCISLSDTEMHVFRKEGIKTLPVIYDKALLFCKIFEIPEVHLREVLIS